MNADFLNRVNGLSVPDALMAYLGAGFSVIPLRGKVPRVEWIPFQQRPPTVADGRKWVREWPGLDSIGFVTGDVNGLYALDTDNPDADAWVRAHAPPTGLVSITRNGRHWFYRIGDMKLTIGKSAVYPGSGIDWRGETGYVVCPPSVHDSGHVYQWSVAPGPIPTLDALGPEIFVGAGGGGPGGGGSGLTDLVYGPSGLIIDGRESFITRRTLGIVASFVRDNKYLPEPSLIADQVWDVCCQKVDLSDGKYHPAYCEEKAAATIRRVKDGIIVIYEDGTIGDQEGYEA